jgi:hypothetical protein
MKRSRVPHPKNRVLCDFRVGFSRKGFQFCHVLNVMTRTPKAEPCVPNVPRYNHRIRQMFARASSGLRMTFPHSLFLVLLRAASLFFSLLIFSPLLCASDLTDSARQFAGRISAITGPGAIALDIANRSSLDEKSASEIRTALEGQLHDRGIRTVSTDQSMGTVNVVLSESLREYVWTAEISIGADQPRTVLISLPRPPSSTPLGPSLPVKLDKTLLFSQPQPILDAVVIDAGEGLIRDRDSGNARLLILDADHVGIYHHLPGHWGEPGGLALPAIAAWELEASLPLPHIRTFPRDLRGHLILRRDHLFDVYLPGVFCRSSSSATAPLRLDCNASDDPWPLTADESGPNAIRAFYASARNFFTGALSPGIGRISNAPAFYTAAAQPHGSYTLWVLAAVDGSTHLIDGVTDQLLHNAYFGNDIVSVRSSCVRHPEILITDAGESNHLHDHDALRAMEIPDRDPVTISPALEFNGSISALWSGWSRLDAVAITHREDTGQYEAYRISTTCTY